MSIEQAIKILDEATQPQNVGKIAREGYCQIEEALRILKAAAAKGDPK